MSLVSFGYGEAFIYFYFFTSPRLQTAAMISQTVTDVFFVSYSESSLHHRQYHECLPSVWRPWCCDRLALFLEIDATSYCLLMQCGFLMGIYGLKKTI